MLYNKTQNFQINKTKSKKKKTDLIILINKRVSFNKEKKECSNIDEFSQEHIYYIFTGALLWNCFFKTYAIFSVEIASSENCRLIFIYVLVDIEHWLNEQ